MRRAPSISCRSCGTQIPDGDRLKSCPNCGAELDPARVPGDLPVPGDSEELQGPAFPREARGNDTAPLSEFVAAGAVIGGLAIFFLGAVLASGIVALVGVVLIFGVTGFYAFFSGSLSRVWRHGLSQFRLGRPGRRDEAEDRNPNRNRD